MEAEIDGVSLFRTLVGQMAPPMERTVHWVRREGGRRHQGQDYYAVRQGRWKLLQNSPFEPFKLFNLRGGPPGGTRPGRTGAPAGLRPLPGASAASPEGRRSPLATRPAPST